MEEIGVSTQYNVVDDSYHSSVSHVFIDSFIVLFSILLLEMQINTVICSVELQVLLLQKL